MRLRSRPTPKAEALRRTWLFASSRGRALRNIAACVDEVHVDAQTVLAREGERAQQVFVLADGLLVLSDAHGGRRLLASGSTVGEAEVLADGCYAGTLVAAEPSRVLVAERRVFRSLLARDPRASIRLARHLAEITSRRTGGSRRAPRRSLARMSRRRQRCSGRASKV